MIKIANNMRVIHSAALLSPGSGILRQMSWERDAATALGIEWTVKMYCPKNSVALDNIIVCDPLVDSASINSKIQKLIAWVKLRYNYHEWLLSQSPDVDVYVLRYYVHDPFQLMFLIKSKKPVFLMHHTLELPELFSMGGVFGFLRWGMERLLGKPTIIKATGIIGVTDEIVNHQIERSGLKEKFSYIYPNGVVYKHLAIKDRRTEDVPELLFVANFSSWHGLDILIDSLSKSSLNLKLHLVGKFDAELIQVQHDSRIVVHGVLNQDEISKLSEQCWIGLSSFALFRKNMKQACPLKVREYLMLGLPVYGDGEDVFPKDSEFFKVGGADIEDIYAFAKSTRIFKKEDVAVNAKPYIDKLTLLAGLNKFLNSMRS